MTVTAAADAVGNLEPKEWAIEAAGDRLAGDPYIPAWDPAEQEWCWDCGAAHPIRHLVWFGQRWHCYDCTVSQPIAGWGLIRG